MEGWFDHSKEVRRQHLIFSRLLTSASPSPREQSFRSRQVTVIALATNRERHRVRRRGNENKRGRIFYSFLSGFVAKLVFSTVPNLKLQATHADCVSFFLSPVVRSLSRTRHNPENNLSHERSQILYWPNLADRIYHRTDHLVTSKCK